MGDGEFDWVTPGRKAQESNMEHKVQLEDPTSFVGRYGVCREGKRGKKNCRCQRRQDGSKENPALVINDLKAQVTELPSARRGSQHCSECQLSS